MIHKVANNFRNGFKNVVNNIQNLQSKYSSFYSEEEYNNIIDEIEKIFGYKVIKLKKGIHSDILSGNDELRVFDKYGDRLTNDYGNNWGEYSLDGILAYDTYYKRFVVFQFRNHFAHSDSCYHIIDGLSKFKNLKNLYFQNFTIPQFDNTFINGQRFDINTDLNKLIIFYKNVHYSQLQDLFERKDNFNKQIELWKFSELQEDISLIEKFELGYKEIIWDNSEYSENEFISFFDISEKTKYFYVLFKEYLKFNFTDIIISAGVDEHKFNNHIIQLSKNINPDRHFSYFDVYVGESPPVNNEFPTNEIKYLKKFIESFKKNYQKSYLDEIKLDFKEFLFFKIKVRTQGTSCNVETGTYHYDYTKDDFLNFEFSFDKKRIFVSIVTNNQKLKIIPDQLIIDDSTSNIEIKDFVKFYSENVIN